MRRIPIYLVLDCSESMVGEPLHAVEQGLASMLGYLRKDPYALEMAYLSVITFGTTARQVTPLTELYQFQIPPLTLGSGTALGAALELTEKRIAAEVQKGTLEAKGDYKPIVILMTDGEPTDQWQAVADRFMKNRSIQTVAFGCGADVNLNTLRRITELVVVGAEANEATFAKFFKWVSASIASASQAVDRGGDGKLSLEKLPPDGDIKVVDDHTPQAKLEPNRFVFLHCRCIKSKKFYLLKFIKNTQARYDCVGAFPLDDFEQTDSGGGITVASNLLGAPAPCPYCGNPVDAHCSCGKMHCCPASNRPIELTCPWCGNRGIYGSGGVFNLGGGAG